MVWDGMAWSVVSFLDFPSCILESFDSIFFSIVSAQQSHISLLFHSLLLLFGFFFWGRGMRELLKVGPYVVFNMSHRKTSIRTWYYSPWWMPRIQDQNLNQILENGIPGEVGGYLGLPEGGKPSTGRTNIRN